MEQKDLVGILVVTNIVTLLIVIMLSQSTTEQSLIINEIDFTIMPDIYNQTYELDVYDCKNFSVDAKEYFEGLGFNVTLVGGIDLEKSNLTYKYRHQFLRIDNSPIYILPEERQIVVTIEDMFEIDFEIDDTGNRIPIGGWVEYIKKIKNGTIKTMED